MCRKCEAYSHHVVRTQCSPMGFSINISVYWIIPIQSRAPLSDYINMAEEKYLFPRTGVKLPPISFVFSREKGSFSPVTKIPSKQTNFQEKSLLASQLVFLLCYITYVVTWNIGMWLLILCKRQHVEPFGKILWHKVLLFMSAQDSIKPVSVKGMHQRPWMHHYFWQKQVW